MSFIYSELFSGLRMSGGYFEFQAPQIRILPIAKASEKQKIKMSRLVRKIVLLNKRLMEIGEKLTDKRTRIENEINRIDSQINDLVYEIYNMTEDEKKIIEESFE